MKLISFYRILKFKQSDWLNKHIDITTDKRTNAANSFEKNILNWWITVYMAKQWKIYEK